MSSDTTNQNNHINLYRSIMDSWCRDGLSNVL